ncbi:MAG TPA: aminoacyl-tRNA hydrolase [Bryobacteraceae bacterium]|nr:aminoacyl-tRNA hydrolase [Bryobacteraceae bacterium]
MYLVVGLGNPGAEYENTPHNLGFRVIDLLAERHAVRVSRKDSKALAGVGEIAAKPVMLAKPQTYMNLSGVSVRALMEKHGFTPADLILVYDELDLPWYEMRIKPRGSAAGHHGVISVIDAVGTNDFVRVRLGVNPGHKVRDGAEYLLAPVKRSQQKETEELVGRGADAVASIIAEGVEKSMTKYNRRAQGSKTEEE